MYEVVEKKRYNMKYYHRDFVWHDVHLADVLSRKSLVAGDNCHRDVTWLSFKFTSAPLFLPYWGAKLKFQIWWFRNIFSRHDLQFSDLRCYSGSSLCPGSFFSSFPGFWGQGPIIALPFPLYRDLAVMTGWWRFWGWGFLKIWNLV